MWILVKQHTVSWSEWEWKRWEATAAVLVLPTVLHLQRNGKNKAVKPGTLHREINKLHFLLLVYLSASLVVATTTSTTAGVYSTALRNKWFNCDLSAMAYRHRHNTIGVIPDLVTAVVVWLVVQNIEVVLTWVQLELECAPHYIASDIVESTLWVLNNPFVWLNSGFVQAELLNLLVVWCNTNPSGWYQYLVSVAMWEYFPETPFD